MLGGVFSNKSCQCMDGTEPLITGSGATVACELELTEKLSDSFRGDIGNGETFDGLAQLRSMNGNT